MEGYFPVLLKVEGKSCLVVGGGQVAERRVASLLDAKAWVTVVSPRVCEGLLELEKEGRITVKRKVYEDGDEKGAFLVIAATDSEGTNGEVCHNALEKGSLVNMAERPELGNFIVPSVVRRGKLVIAVSTLGASPSVAISVRKKLEADFGEEYEIYLDFLSEFRLKVQELVKDTKQRHEWFREIMKLDLLGKIRSGEFEAWKREVLEGLSRSPATFELGNHGQNGGENQP